MSSLFEAYITNLGKYNEGRLVGETLKFPATTEEVQALLARIGVDGKRYEELFITDYESDIAGLTENLGEYESIDELNYLAALLEELDDRGELSKFEAALELGDYCGSVQELINLTQNLDDYDFYPDIADEEDLGRYYVDDLDALQIPESIEQYFDYEAYGRDIVLNSSCTFASSGFMFSPFILIFLLPLATYSPFSSFKITSPSFSILSVTRFSPCDIESRRSSLTIPSASVLQ